MSSRILNIYLESCRFQRKHTFSLSNIGSKQDKVDERKQKSTFFRPFLPLDSLTKNSQFIEAKTFDSVLNFSHPLLTSPDSAPNISKYLSH